MLYLKYPEKYFRHVLVVPFISTVIIPLIITDLWIEIYHRICFPLCGIPYIKRRQYIQIVDRSKLQYLDWMEKIWCMYCGYGNGVIRYWSQIAAATEAYWCGIKHKPIKGFVEQDHQKNFAAYGDEKDFNDKYCKLKKQ